LAKQYPDVFVDNTKAKPTIEKFTIQQIEEILEKRGSGMTWLKISEEMHIPRITLTRIIEQLDKSKPGDRTYNLAVKYGYVVE
jgi:response regulator of citrate/malate metabolism